MASPSPLIPTTSDHATNILLNSQAQQALIAAATATTTSTNAIPMHPLLVTVPEPFNIAPPMLRVLPMELEEEILDRTPLFKDQIGLALCSHLVGQNRIARLVLKRRASAIAADNRLYNVFTRGNLFTGEKTIQAPVVREQVLLKTRVSRLGRDKPDLRRRQELGLLGSRFKSMTYNDLIAAAKRDVLSLFPDLCISLCKGDATDEVRKMLIDICQDEEDSRYFVKDGKAHYLLCRMDDLIKDSTLMPNVCRGNLHIALIDPLALLRPDLLPMCTPCLTQHLEAAMVSMSDMDAYHVGYDNVGFFGSLITTASLGQYIEESEADMMCMLRYGVKFSTWRKAIDHGRVSIGYVAAHQNRHEFCTYIIAEIRRQYTGKNTIGQRQLNLTGLGLPPALMATLATTAPHLLHHITTPEWFHHAFTYVARRLQERSDYDLTEALSRWAVVEYWVGLLLEDHKRFPIEYLCIKFQTAPVPLLARGGQLQKFTCTASEASRYIHFIHDCTIEELGRLPLQTRQYTLSRYIAADACLVAAFEMYTVAVLHAVQDIIAVLTGGDQVYATRIERFKQFHSLAIKALQPFCREQISVDAKFTKHSDVPKDQTMYGAMELWRSCFIPASFDTAMYNFTAKYIVTFDVEQPDIRRLPHPLRLASERYGVSIGLPFRPEELREDGWMQFGRIYWKAVANDFGMGDFVNGADEMMTEELFSVLKR